MFEFIIVVVIAVAVWLYLKKKNEEAGSTSTPAPAASQKKSSEPESKIEQQSEPTVQKVVSVEPAEVSVAVDIVPKDSALRRHYLQNLAAQANDSTGARDVVEIEAPVISAPVASVVEEPGIEEPSASNVPEDAALKRHHIQQLVAETEAGMPPRPTDSMLRRHYDTQLLSAVMSKLDGVS